jgi:hypothetical protein
MEFTATVKAQLIAMIDGVREFVSGLTASPDVSALNARIVELEAVVGVLSQERDEARAKIVAGQAAMVIAQAALA